MDFILIYLTLGAVVADKLDRSYLPPPGSKYAGGTPGSIDLPLEYPKTTLTTDQDINQNGAFEIAKNPQFNFAQSSDTQIKKDPGIPIRSSQGEFLKTRKPITESTNDRPGNSSFRTYEDKSYLNGAISDGINRPAISNIQNVENNVNNASNDAKSILENENLKTIPQLSLHDQPRVVSVSINTSNKLMFPPLLRTGQGSTYSLGGETDFRQLPMKTQEEITYGKGELGIKLPFENNMYKDSINYGTQTMYRPDIVSPEFSRDNLAPILSTHIVKPGSDLSYLNTKQNVENVQNMYPDQARSQSLFTSPDFNFLSLNKATIYPNDNSASTNTYQNTDIVNQSPTIADNVDTILNYKNAERPEAETDRTAYILRYENVITPEGFSYSYDTSNGIHADESGTAGNGVKAKGSYSYTGDDGKVYTIKYTADENGFRPVGDHLPTPPPIPIEIQAALNQITLEDENNNLDDGSYDEKKYGYENYKGKMDRFNPIQDVIIEENIKNVKDINRKPNDKVRQKENENVNNEINTQKSSRYPSIYLTTKHDSNDNEIGIKIPNLKNLQYSKNINEEEQNLIKDNLKINDNNLNSPKTFNSNIDKLRMYNPINQIMNTDDLRQKIMSTTVNRYLPEFEQNVFSYKIDPQNDANMNYIKTDQQNKQNSDKITSFTTKNSNEPANTIVTKIYEVTSRPSSQKTNLKPSYTIQYIKETSKEPDTLKVNEHNGYYYTSPDKNFKDTLISFQNTTPNLNSYEIGSSDYIPTLRTNYASSNFNLPSTTDTDKYYYTYNEMHSNEDSTPLYESTSYYDQSTPSVDYNTNAMRIKPSNEIGQPKLPYDQEYTQDREENGTRPTQKSFFGPDQKFYTKYQGNTTPTTVDNITNGETDGNLSSNRNYDSAVPSQVDTSNNNIYDVSTGYIYDKPKYGNQLLYKENNRSNIYSDSDISDDKDMLSNSDNFDNQRDIVVPSRDFQGKEEENYFISDNVKTPKYENIEKDNDQIIKDSPKSKTFKENLYIVENNDDKKQDSKKSDRPFIPAAEDFTNFNPRLKDIDSSVNQDNEKVKKPINRGNYILNGSRYNKDDISRPNVVPSERIVGEDFSGPKRPQSFDTTNGYYY